MPPMTTSTIVESIQAYIRDQILFGDERDLSSYTPLLQLGILDSFSLIALVAHLNDSFGIDIGANELNGRNFLDIDSIARLVERLLSESAAEPAPRPGAVAAHQGVIVFEAPSCAQLFIVFTGLGRELMKDSADFFRWSGLEDRNVILLHDASGYSYKHGVSEKFRSRDQICDWLAAWLAERTHITEVYCLGISAGGPMAMIAGHRLRAKTVWSFAPRTARGNVAKETQEELAKFVHRVTGKTVPELERGMTQLDRDNISTHITTEMVDSYYSSLLDADRLLDTEHLAEVVKILSPGNGVTEHRLYYVARDSCDSRVAQTLKDCPGVTLITLEPSDAPPPAWAFTPWIHPVPWVLRDHLVVDLLRERGEFSKMFPAIRPVAAGVGLPLSFEVSPEIIREEVRKGGGRN